MTFVIDASSFTIIDMPDVRTLKTHHPVQFSKPDGTPVLTFTTDGRLEPGAGMSDDEITRGVFNAMANQWPDLIREWAKSNEPSAPAS